VFSTLIHSVAIKLTTPSGGKVCGTERKKKRKIIPNIVDTIATPKGSAHTPLGPKFGTSIWGQYSFENYFPTK
jgi:hypothetical protein